jgi:drug/metabolite transporter (DMT)-like permease
MTPFLLAGSVLAATFPDPGTTEIVAFSGALGGFLGVLVGLHGGDRRNRDELYWYAFAGGMLGTGGGLAMYIFGLVSGLY